MFGWDALNASTSFCIVFAAVSVCACQNWMVTVPVGVAPDGDGLVLELDDPVHAVTTRANTETPASNVRFISTSSSRSLAALWSPLDGPRDCLHEPALTNEEHEEHRRRRQYSAGHDGRPLGL